MTYLIVSGVRRLPDDTYVRGVLDATRPQRVWHGGAGGVDAAARRWAADRGLVMVVHHADWKTGRSAGPVRNARMVDDAVAHAAAHGRAPHDVTMYAFPAPGSRGTWHAARYAKRRGVRVRVFPIEADGTGADAPFWM